MPSPQGYNGKAGAAWERSRAAPAFPFAAAGFPAAYRLRQAGGRRKGEWERKLSLAFHRKQLTGRTRCVKMKTMCRIEKIRTVPAASKTPAAAPARQRTADLPSAHQGCVGAQAGEREHPAPAFTAPSPDSPVKACRESEIPVQGVDQKAPGLPKHMFQAGAQEGESARYPPGLVRKSVEIRLRRLKNGL